ncbi:MAG: Gfo/Idh/MocA family oxidoreductase [Eubacteriales bacterium]|nr:Gfo/Idh/MocA family oxidoreductase [Eubacteriales bacterium]
MEKVKPVRVAIIGCGAISGIYFENITKKFSILELAGCCDLNTKLAEETAQKYQIPVLTMEEIIADETIEIVINLTTPAAHYSVIRNLLEHGKNVYTEKVLAVEKEQAADLVRIADENKVLLCAAPDTFLGAAAQTARFAVDSGLIGEVTSCIAVLQRDAGLLAEKYPYTAKKGGGIGIDVGVYYATVLLSILGPAVRVCGISKTHEPQRTHFFTSKGLLGEKYEMEAETLLAATVQFESGAVGSLHFNSASIRCEKPLVILYGTEGILYLSDPNCFGGEVKILAKGQAEPYVLPATHAYSANERGLGVAEMAWAMRKGRTPRTHKEMAYHALELLTGAIESSETGNFYEMRSRFEQQPPLSRGYMDETYSMSEPEAALVF